MLEERKPQNNLKRVTISFGDGSGANKKYKRFREHIPLMKLALRADGNHPDAHRLYAWTLCSRSRADTYSAWTVELTALEWQSLSRGLRCTGKDGLSLFAWINNHKESEYEE